MSFVTFEHLLVLISTGVAIGYFCGYIAVMKNKDGFTMMLLQLSRPRWTTVVLSIAAYAAMDYLWGDWTLTIYNVIFNTLCHTLWYITDKYPNCNHA